MKIDNLGIVGTGEVARLMAKACIVKNKNVLLVDAKKESLEKLVADISSDLDQELTDDQKKSLGKEALLERLKLSLDLKPLADCQLVFESITENEKLKLDLFSELDSICPPQTLFVSNTSLVSITKLGQITQNPKRVLGAHFLYPVLPLVEVVRGVDTDPVFLATLQEFVTDLGFDSITCHDYPGYVIYRGLIPWIFEAITLVYEGISTAQEIDKALKGPLHLADQIGLDRLLQISRHLFRATGNTKFIPPPLLVKYAEAGLTGVAAKRGFFTY